jgi:hypothetical protein
MRWGLLLATVCACGGSGGSASIATDAGSGTGLTDAGTLDAGAADDCTGVVPAVPASASAFDVGAAPGQSCSFAFTDSSGVIAAESHSGMLSGDAAQVDWHEFDARGITAGSFTGGASLSPQASGFLGLQGALSSLNVDWWSGTGSLQNLMPIGDGTAGVAIATGFPTGAIVARNTGTNIVVQSFDANANLVNSVPIATSASVLAVAQDRGTIAAGAADQEAVLVVLSNGQGVWVDLAAGTSGTPFSIGTGTAAIARALIGGGVAVRFDGHWTAVVNSANTVLTLPPAWMTDGSDFTIARGGKAYAVTTPGSNVIPLAVGRTTCGAITLPSASSVSVGLEGTVIGSSGPAGCSKIFWSRLLQ